MERGQVEVLCSHKGGQGRFVLSGNAGSADEAKTKAEECYVSFLEGSREAEYVVESDSQLSEPDRVGICKKCGESLLIFLIDSQSNSYCPSCECDAPPMTPPMT